MKSIITYYTEITHTYMAHTNALHICSRVNTGKYKSFNDFAYFFKNRFLMDTRQDKDILASIKFKFRYALLNDISYDTYDAS